MVDEDAVTGLTSNPSIFQKAISRRRRLRRPDPGVLEETDDPRDDLLLARDRGHSRRLRRARVPSGSATAGFDGYVSIEVDPRSPSTPKATSTRRSAPRAGRAPEPLHQDPGDEGGPPGDRGLHRAGDPDQHHADLLARALRRRSSRPICAGSSGCCRGRRPVEGLLGRIVLRLSPRHRNRQPARGGSGTRSSRASSGSRTRGSPTSISRRPSRADAGSAWPPPARPKQRPLWASTSTKNPAYRDVIYVEELIGPDTVNTMPLETLEPSATTARFAATRSSKAWRRREQLLADLAAAGVDYDDVVAGARDRRRPEVRRCLRRADRRDPSQAGRAGGRLDTGGASSSHGSGPATRRSGRVRTRRAGSAGSTSRAGCARTSTVPARLAADLAEESDTVVLLGMGGSSLAPEVLRRSFRARTLPRARHDPSAAPSATLEAQLDLDRTLFVSASKSGWTLETRSHADYFWQKRRTASSGSRSPILARALEALAQRARLRGRLPGEPTIGGRYSALSPFGLVPAALMGVDVAACSTAPRDGGRLPARRGQSRARARARARRGLAGGPRQDLPCRTPASSGSGSSS